MINKVLTVLKDRLNIADGLQDTVVVENISKHDDGAAGLDNKVVITLLNVEEESTLKNKTRYNKTKISTTPLKYEMKAENPPAYVNLYVMISANRTSYEISLANISKVIEVLQESNMLQYNDIDPQKNFKFRVEMHSIPFDQLSYIWGLLGSKIMPSVLYKISVIKIVREGETEIGLIDEVNIEANIINTENIVTD